MAQRIPPLDTAVLRRISEILGATEDGLIGREIGRFLADARIADPGEMTKRERLYVALTGVQQQDNAANSVLRFVTLVMKPVRFVDRPDQFESWQEQLNEALAFARLSIGDDGRVRSRGSQAKTVADARKRASRLKAKLRDRGVHAEVLRACAAEIDDENYFHSVFEAAKSLAARLRSMSGLTGDGAVLVNAVLGRGRGFPVIALNGLEDQTDESEHDGYANLMRGVFGAFRNSLAHRPKVSWTIPEQDALDMMSTISLLHRRLDQAAVVPESVRTNS